MSLHYTYNFANISPMLEILKFYIFLQEIKEFAQAKFIRDLLLQKLHNIIQKGYITRYWQF